MKPIIRKLLSKPHFTAAKKQVETLERKLGVRLPQELVELVLYIDEGHLNDVRCFSVRSQCFDFHAIQKAHSKFYGTDVFSDYESYFRSDFPGIVPIGGEGNGDSICLDYRSSAERPVVLKRDHEIGYSTDFPFYFLARDFAELLDRADPSRYAHYDALDDSLTQEGLDEVLSYHDTLSIEHRAFDEKYGRYATTRGESGRDGRIAPATPPTPPGMRLRTGRFQ